MDPTPAHQSPPYRLPNGLSVFHLNKHETDFLYQEMFVEKASLKHGITLPEGACVLDVGANIGMFAVFVMHTCPSATVHAFEPTPELLQILALNAAPFGSRVKIHSCGPSDHDGQATFSYYPNYSILSGFHADPSGDAAVLSSGIRNQLQKRKAGGDVPEEYIRNIAQQKLAGRRDFTCPLRAVSSVLREEAIACVDLLKIDAERSELAILRGIEDGDWEKIRQLVLEIHDSSELQLALPLLQARGFRVTVEQESQFADSGVFNCFAVRS